MVNLKNVYNYWKQYGVRSLVGLVWEKLIIDPRRFRGGIERSIPDFTPQPFPDLFKSCDFKGRTLCYLIHYFYPTKKGGTERFTYNLAQANIMDGNRALVITLGNRPLAEYPFTIGDIFFRYYEYEGVPVIEIRHRHAPIGLYYKRIDDSDTAMAVFARHIIEYGHVDIVHATYPQPFASFLAVCAEKNVPYMVTLTDFAMLCHYSTMVDKRGNFCGGSQCGKRCEKICSTYGIRSFLKRYYTAARVLQSAYCITAPSKFVGNIFKNDFPGTQVKVIPHGIGGIFTSARKRSETKRFLYAGTLAPLKGVHLLVQAFCAVKGDITLDIYGDGNKDYIIELKRMADERVTFPGAVSGDNMPEVFNQADCVIISSVWYETYNFVAREALACGCIVVASRIGALPEAISEGENGFSFETGNIDDLQKALNRARQFDWSRYKTSIFPSREKEYLEYRRLYEQVY
ncbi:MAG: glycosyltransferase [Syntrophomonadaceae bacterium]|nr:glycosyltransferase [Syntrophomonadaceae bacterium]